MQLHGAFFANRAAVVNDMLNIEGGVWASTTVPLGSAGFNCTCVVLCEAGPYDIGRQYSLCIDAAGPTGGRWKPAWSTDFTVASPMSFMLTPTIALPIEPDGGHHVYSFRLGGQHARVDVGLDVHLAPGTG